MFRSHLKLHSSIVHSAYPPRRSPSSLPLPLSPLSLCPSQALQQGFSGMATTPWQTLLKTMSAYSLCARSPATHSSSQRHSAEFRCAVSSTPEHSSMWRSLVSMCDVQTRSGERILRAEREVSGSCSYRAGGERILQL